MPLPFFCPGSHPASCTMGTGSFPWVKSGQGVTLIPHPLLVLWSRRIRAIPLLPLWAVQPVQSVSTCARVYFIHTFPPCFGVSHTIFRENLAHSLFENICFYKPVVCGTLVASKHVKDTTLLLYNIFTMFTVIFVAFCSVCYSVPTLASGHKFSLTLRALSAEKSEQE